MLILMYIPVKFLNKKKRYEYETVTRTNLRTVLSHHA